MCNIIKIKIKVVIVQNDLQTRVMGIKMKLTWITNLQLFQAMHKGCRNPKNKSIRDCVHLEILRLFLNISFFKYSLF